MNLADFILVSVPLVLHFFAAKDREQDFDKMLAELKEQLDVPVINTYDFIVVGGGTAGCLVAGRLSEHGFSVLLIEAGGNPVPQTEVPAYLNAIGFDPVINYVFTPVPQPNAAQESGGLLPTFFARMLGGGGSHNDMQYNRGNPRDFDNWATITQDPGWCYDSVLQYFKRHEDFIGVLFNQGKALDINAYGHEGPLQVDTYLHPLLPVWLQAGRELGYNVADPNGPQQPSFTPLNVMLSHGKRVSSYKGFVKPFEGKRTTLTVLRYSDVSEVLIDKNQNAYGVQFSRHGVEGRAYARKEVIISAGTVRSPLLLMKSGVGPVDVLQEAGIPVKVARPGVGRNLWEQPQAYVGPIYINDSSLLPKIHDGDEEELVRYRVNGGGQLGETKEGPLAFLVSSRAKAAGEGDWPDTQIWLLQSSLGIEPAPDGREFVIMFVANTRPSTPGSIQLNGTAWRAGETDDQKLAVIDLKLLADPSDVEVIVEGIKIGLNVFENTAAFRKAGARYGDPPYEQCAAFKYRSDEYWRCYIRFVSSQFYHWAGTNRMGKSDDPMAVVDTKLRVIGVKGLRVIDASIMPKVTNSNTNSPTLMIAEKGVYEILKVHVHPS